MAKIIYPIGKPWSIKKVWNDCFDIPPQAVIPRDYLYASEVGHSFINVYYKMKGVQPTNYPTSVAKMKMEAGKVWESIVRMVLKRAGIMQSAQEKVDFNLRGLLSVHGRMDFIGGGAIDLDQIAETSMHLKMLWEEMDMPETYVQIADRTLESVAMLAERGVTLLETMPLEVKSVSSYVWNMIEGTGKPTPYHESQTFHYTHGKKLPKGRVIYINRDDCRIEEMDVMNDDENLGKYKAWVKLMSEYWYAQEEPEKEELIGFNTIDFKFRKKTMEIEWSPYLKLIYGFASPMEYREVVDKPVKSFNYTFTRCVNGDKMTPTNLAAIQEAKKLFPFWDDYVEMAKAKKAEGKLNLVEVVDE